jgi:hypothetical protein
MNPNDWANRSIGALKKKNGVHLDIEAYMDGLRGLLTEVDCNFNENEQLINIEYEGRKLPNCKSLINEINIVLSELKVTLPALETD